MHNAKGYVHNYYNSIRTIIFDLVTIMLLCSTAQYTYYKILSKVICGARKLNRTRGNGFVVCCVIIYGVALVYNNYYLSL